MAANEIAPRAKAPTTPAIDAGVRTSWITTTMATISSPPVTAHTKLTTTCDDSTTHGGADDARKRRSTPRSR